MIGGQLRMAPADSARLISDLRHAEKTGEPRVVTHQFSFCRQYQATPASLLSYLEWTPQRVLTSSARLPIPSLFIMGGRDDRLDSGWVDKLKIHNRVVVVPGANHFMDGEHEFDLLDTVLKELKS
jgi:pimeloyl-ACP methyl ester carboxylesterase